MYISSSALAVFSGWCAPFGRGPRESRTRHCRLPTVDRWRAAASDGVIHFLGTRDYTYQHVGRGFGMMFDGHAIGLLGIGREP